VTSFYEVRAQNYNTALKMLKTNNLQQEACKCAVTKQRLTTSSYFEILF